MKRLHVHMSVENLEDNIRFYSNLFASDPTVQHEDYAKWMLDDPRVNFAISNRGAKPGIDHLGMQTDNDEELVDLKQRLDVTQQPIKTQENTACCYATSDKHWVTDPQGIAWESFHSLSEIPTFNEPVDIESETNESACCAPVAKETSSCCG